MAKKKTVRADGLTNTPRAMYMDYDEFTGSFRKELMRVHENEVADLLAGRSRIPAVSPVRSGTGPGSSGCPRTGPDGGGLARPTPYGNTGVKKAHQAQNGISGNSPKNSCKVSIDWLTVTTREDRLGKFIDILKDAGLYGDVVEVNGKNGYKNAVTVGKSALIMWGFEHENSSLCLKIMGEGCIQIGAHSMIKLLGSLYSLLGVKATRLDIALDFVGGVETLLDDIKTAHENRHICHLRGFTPLEPQLDGVYQGRTLYVGSRASEVFLRVYDKGLESKTAKHGDWIRFEAQFQKAKANALAMDLITADLEGKDMSKLLASRCLEVVDFRNGDKQTKYNRRKPLAWWSSLKNRAGSVSLSRLEIDRSEASFLSFQTAFQKQYAPTILSIADELQIPPEAVVSLMLIDAHKGGNPETIAQGRKCLREWIEAQGLPF